MWTRNTANGIDAYKLTVEVTDPEEGKRVGVGWSLADDATKELFFAGPDVVDMAEGGVGRIERMYEHQWWLVLAMARACGTIMVFDRDAPADICLVHAVGHVPVQAVAQVELEVICGHCAHAFNSKATRVRGFGPVLVCQEHANPGEQRCLHLQRMSISEPVSLHA